METALTTSWLLREGAASFRSQTGGTIPPTPSMGARGSAKNTQKHTDRSRTGSHIPTNQCQSSAPSRRTGVHDDSLVRITGWICTRKYSHFKRTHAALRVTDFSLNAQPKSTISVSVTSLQMRSSPGQPWVRLLGPCIVFLSSWKASLAGLSYPGTVWLLYTLASLTSFFFFLPFLNSPCRIQSFGKPCASSSFFMPAQLSLSFLSSLFKV